MAENKILGLVLCFVILLCAFLMWIVYNSPIAFIFGSFGLIFLIRFIYEYKTQKKDRFFTIFGLCFVIFLIAFLMWIVYNSPIAFIFGLLGLIFLIKFIYEYKTQKTKH